jgi:hypothetical protein
MKLSSISRFASRITVKLMLVLAGKNHSKPILTRCNKLFKEEVESFSGASKLAKGQFKVNRVCVQCL